LGVVSPVTVGAAVSRTLQAARREPESSSVVARLESEMRWSGFRSLLLVALAAAAPAGCASNTTSPTPPPVLTTETFTGTISRTGNSAYAFTAKSGQVTVTLFSLTPDSTLKLSLSLGVYNPYYGQCTALTGNGAIAVGGQLIGLATATTSLCVQIADTSNIPAGATETFVIKAEHY
jgi:hypothetical protein